MNQSLLISFAEFAPRTAQTFEIIFAATCAWQKFFSAASVSEGRAYPKGTCSASLHGAVGRNSLGRKVVRLFASYSSSSLRRPATSDTGREKLMAPAGVEGPASLLMAFMMAAFSLPLATM